MLHLVVAKWLFLIGGFNVTAILLALMQGKNALFHVIPVQESVVMVCMTGMKLMKTARGMYLDVIFRILT